MRAIWPFLLQQCVPYISQCTAAASGETPGNAHGSIGRGRYYPLLLLSSHRSIPTLTSRQSEQTSGESKVYHKNEFHGSSLDRQFVAFANIIVIRRFSSF
jgi:hypothetical protein